MENRTCPVCADEYVPYRANQRSCSRRCYRRLPDVRAKDNARHNQPEARERALAARRRGGHLHGRYLTDQRNRRYRKVYGITPDQYDAMLTGQGGRCAICGNPPDPNGVRAASRLHVDHCHETGRVRGLLCSRCNQGLGYFRDDENLLLAAVRYLKEN